MIFCFQWNTSCIKWKHKIHSPKVIIFWHAQELYAVCKNLIIMVPIDEFVMQRAQPKLFQNLLCVCAFKISDFISEF